MTHLELGVLQAYLDDEMAADARVDIENHLQACPVCAAELEQLREASTVFAAAVAGTDVVVPVLTAQARFAKLRRQDDRSPVAPRRALARAAMFIVGLAAVASAAVPGSPVRGWISDALTRVGLLDQPQSAAAPAVIDEAPAVATDSGATAAISIEPVDGRVRVVLTNVHADATVSVETVAATRAFVETKGLAAQARFRTGPGRIEVIDIGGGNVVVQIPSSVKDATVEQDGRVIFTTGR